MGGIINLQSNIKIDHKITVILIKQLNGIYKLLLHNYEPKHKNILNTVI